MEWPFQSLGDVASFLGLIFTVAYNVFRVRGYTPQAFEQVRRCRTIQRSVARKIETIRERLVKISRCLCDEADEKELEIILYDDSNQVEELREFSEQSCPDLDVTLQKRTYVVGIFGLIYITYGFLTGNFLSAFFFSLLGFAPIFVQMQSNYQQVRSFTLSLDEVNDKFKGIIERLEKLEETCKKRGGVKI